MLVVGISSCGYGQFQSIEIRSIRYTSEPTFKLHLKNALVPEKYNTKNWKYSKEHGLYIEIDNIPTIEFSSEEEVTSLRKEIFGA